MAKQFNIIYNIHNSSKITSLCIDLSPFLLIVKKPPRPMENMNGEYKISNPNPLAGAQFDSDYSKFPDVEYFDVSSTKSAASLFLVLLD